MCLTCGCMFPSLGVVDLGQADSDHGVTDHLTISDLIASAAASGISPAEAAKRIRQSADAWGEAHPSEYGLTQKQAKKREP